MKFSRNYYKETCLKQTLLDYIFSELDRYRPHTGSAYETLADRLMSVIKPFPLHDGVQIRSSALLIYSFQKHLKKCTKDEYPPELEYGQ